MFVDKFYEELDDISKMIEPLNYAANDIVAKIPEKIDVTKLISCGHDYNRQNDIKRLLHRFMDEHEDLRQFKDISSDRAVIDLFKFDIEYNSDFIKEIFIDGYTGEVSGGKIFIVKKSNMVDDDTIERMIRDKFAGAAHHWSSRPLSATRVAEVCGIYGVNTGSIRSANKKYKILINHINNMLREKKLNIKDVGLSEKLGKWILLYVRDGNLGALQNLTKVKIMTHADRAIYSIEEKEV